MTTWGSWYWTTVLVGGLVLIVGPEIYALITNSHNTLSYYVWSELHVRPGIRFWNWPARTLLVFSVWASLGFWLTAHFFWRKFT